MFFAFIIILKSVIVSTKYMWISEYGEKEIDMCDCQNRRHNTNVKMKLLYILRFVDNMFDFILIMLFYNYIHGMYNFWDQLFKENVCNEMEDEDNAEKYNELLIEYHFASN